MNKTTLKARCGTEIRKNWIHHNNDMSMNDLVAKMQRYFSIGDAAIKLKYRDEEKDRVTLTDDDELAYALKTMREQLYVDVIGAENAVGEIAAGETEVKTGPEEAAKMAHKESPATLLSSIGELTEIPLSLLLGIPPVVHTESKELAEVAQTESADNIEEQQPQFDLVQLLHRVCDDPAIVRAVADELIANPPTEDDLVLCVQFLPQMWNQPNAPTNPHQSIVAALSNNINGGTNLSNANIAFSFATWERLFACRNMLSKPGGPGNQTWAFYAGPLMAVAQLGAIAPVGVQPTASTFLITGVTSTTEGQLASVCRFKFFEA